MVTPLHLAHLDPLIPCDSLGRLSNLDRVLLVRKIFLSIQVFHRQLLFRYSQTLLQLIYVKYIMHVRQLWRQLQLVGYFTSLLQNLELSNDPRCEIASDLEMTQTPHSSYLEVNKISNFKA
jgi:hypothetical protein